MTPTMEKRKFTAKEIETRLFRHAHPTLAGEKQNHSELAVVEQHDDGYCTCAEFVGKGIRLPLIQCWSGCLEPVDDMTKDEALAVVEVRKAASVMATEKRKA